MRIHDIINEGAKKIHLPKISIKKPIYHVGSMNIQNRKTTQSHEGKSLSVSTEPESWMRINRGNTVGDIWLLEKKGHAFIDVHSIDENTWSLLQQWGIDNNYFTAQRTYKYCYMDDELEEMVCMEFDSYEEALEEVHDPDDEDDIANIEVDDNGIVATELFIRATGNREHTDLIVALYCVDNNINVDGLWWWDEHNVHKFSAPRGSIFDHMVKTWKVEKITPSIK